MACSRVLQVRTPKIVGDACFQPRLGDSLGCFRGNVVEVGCIAPNDRSETDHSVIAAALTELTRRHGDFQRTRHANDIDRFGPAARAFQGIERAAQQAVRDEAVEAADDDREPQPLAAQLAFNRPESFFVLPHEINGL